MRRRDAALGFGALRLFAKKSDRPMRAVRLVLMMLTGAAWGVVCLNLLLAPWLREPAPMEWQIPILFTSAAMVLVFRREIATRTGWSAVRSATKIVAIHVPVFLVVLAAETILTSGGELSDNALSLLVYGTFYAMLLSPFLVVLAVASQFVMRPIARWTEVSHA